MNPSEISINKIEEIPLTPELEKEAQKVFEALKDLKERNDLISMATCLAEVELLRTIFENVMVRTMYRLKHGPDPELTNEWFLYTEKVRGELQKWQSRFYTHCKRNP